MNKRTSSIKIVGGEFKGFKIPFLKSENLRPTLNKSRETLFNWLMYEITGANCLDMFSGSGALGLEALSRGAKYVYFLELSKKRCEKIQQTISILKLEGRSNIFNVNSLDISHNEKIKRKYDIIFLDPPYRMNFLKKIHILLEENQFVDKQTMIYAEAEKELHLDKELFKWNQIKYGSGGQTTFGLFKKC